MKQNGFSKVVGLAILALVVVIGLGILTLQSDDNDSDQVSQQSSQQSNQSASNDTGPLGEKQVIEFQETVSILNVSDEEKLPPSTPESFVSYMGNLIASSRADENGCRPTYKVTKISNVNISGAIVGYGTPLNNPEEKPCDAGANRALWYFKNGTWTLSESIGGQGIAPCSELEAIPVYAEFEANCFNESPSAPVPNPVGKLSES